MKRMIGLAALTAWFWCFAAAWADEYRVEALKEPAPADALSPEIASELAPEGFQVVRGESRVVCQVWFAKQWLLKDAKPASLDIIYPFQPGQLIGVLRYPRRSGDFRDQQISSGVYTLRYSLQPVDGAHVGTSPTRDFLLLIAAENDPSPDPMEYDTLVELSTEAADAAHPALLSMQRPLNAAAPPSIRHDERHDWWIVRLPGTAKVDGQVQELAIDLVVVGHADE